MKGLVPKTVFMLNTGAQSNLVKARCVYPDTLREDKLYIQGITDGCVESLESIQVSFKGHPITMNIVPDDFSIPQEGILNGFFERTQ